MINKHYLLALLVLLTPLLPAMAQRGLPPRKTTRSVSITNYPQVIDFLPEMVNLLKVPDGWEVSVAASGLGKPRMLYPGPNGSLYVTRRDAGDVLLLKDTNGDNKFDDLITVLSDFRGVHGITMKDGWMYLANNTDVRRFPVADDGGLGQGQVLIYDMPSGGQHPNRTLEWGPDGMLYISVGSLCNDCKEADKEAATMLQVDPKNWSRTIFASGLRNTIGFDFHPQTGKLWGADNGGDAKGSKWPPEEINLIEKGGHYGWPLAYGKQEVDQSREDPAGEIKEAVVKNTKPSVLELTAHMAPIAFKFLGKAANLPADYAEDALVAWHGSWNADKPVGFKVQRIHFKNGTAVSADDFLSGFLKGNARFGRPTGIAVTSAGIVYISDDANGVIYAVKRKM